MTDACPQRTVPSRMPRPTPPPPSPTSPLQTLQHPPVSMLRPASLCNGPWPHQLSQLSVSLLRQQFDVIPSAPSDPAINKKKIKKMANAKMRWGPNHQVRSTLLVSTLEHLPSEICEISQLRCLGKILHGPVRGPGCKILQAARLTKSFVFRSLSA